jgi:hypothetical protein
MPSTKEQEILRLAEQARAKADAFIVIGIMPGGSIFQTSDPRISIPDLHRALKESVDFICECVAHARKAKEGK